MYKQNSRDSCKCKDCSPYQLCFGLIGLKSANGYFAYTDRWRSLYYYHNNLIDLMKMKNKLNFLLVFILIAAIASCEKEENSNREYSFSLETKYDSIRSCPGGGGIFIIKLNNSQNQTENVDLKLECDGNLNATLSKDYISIDQSVFEVSIRPSNEISISDFNIIVIGERKGQLDSLNLSVKIFDWENSSRLNEISSIKKLEFIGWLNTNYPDISINNQTDWEIYLTYPQTLIIEHYTLLNEQYEMRICCHVMIPPDDWSMIRLRERNSYTPFLAARKDSTGGVIYQIPVEEYPVKSGY